MLASIFQQSLKSGQVPSDWRTANVVPIFKKGDRSKPANYRPVSLTAICCKLMEHILVSNIMGHLDQHQILTDYQHGFRHHRSCETQLLITSHDLAAKMNQRKQVDMAVLDFSKAFDKVPHHRLVSKLHYYGVRGPSNTWVKHFLLGRKQRVVVDGEFSDESPVVSGVPQGSVLGPLLFLAFINDIADNISSNIRLFADDCLLYRTINNEHDQKLFQQDLNSLHEWSNLWNMEFNVAKCFTMHITQAKKHKRLCTYHMGGTAMQTTESTAYLGITINKDLKWNQHINIIAAKANRVLGMLRRNLRRAPRKVKQAAYTTLVRPRVEYCSTIWDPYQKQQVNQIEMVQRRAARFVLDRPYRRDTRDSVTSMLQELQWKSLAERRRDRNVTFMYKITNGLVAVPPEYHPTPWITRSRRSKPHCMKLYQPSIDVYKYSFLPRTVIQWNALTTDVATAATLELFKSRLATTST